MGRGALVFKGDAPKKKKSKRKHKKSTEGGSRGHERIDAQERSSPVANDSTSSLATASASSLNPPPTAASGRVEPPAQQVGQPQIQKGTGQITTSGTVVTGHGTSFQSEISAGDAVIVHNGKNGDEEMRVVTMVLSPMSMNLSTPFSSNLKHPTAWRYIRKPRDERHEKATKARQAVEEKEEQERMAFGTYGTKEIVYREKTEHGSYRIRREQASSEMSRADLLTVRTKKKSDKYC